MPKTIEVIWLANVLVFVGSLGLGSTLVGWVQQTRKAAAMAKKKGQ